MITFITLSITFFRLRSREIISLIWYGIISNIN